MKAILIRFAIFILPVLLLMGGLEYVQRELPHDYKRKKELLEKSMNEWEGLVMGSSHSYLGVNPAYLSFPAFNLAYTAQTFTFDEFLLEKYLDQMPSLKYVIYPISYPSYGSEAFLFKGIYNKTYYFKHFFGSDAFTKWYEPENYSLTALYTVKRSVDRAMRYYQGEDSLVEFDQNGWYYWKDSLTRAELQQNGKQSCLFHDQFYDEDLEKENIERLSSIIEICQSKGVMPILISTPMHQSYREHMNERRYQFMAQTTDSLAHVYDIPYWNFFEDPQFEDGDFMDSNHLGKQGAPKFTRILDAMIQKLSN